MIVIACMIHNMKSILPSRDIVQFLLDNTSSEDRYLLLNTTPTEVFNEVRERTLDGELDMYFLVGSPNAYTSETMRSVMGTLLYLSKISIYVTNDYKLKPPSQCKSGALKEFMDYKGESKDYYGFQHVISTLRDLKYAGTSHYVDWNMVVYGTLPNARSYNQRLDGLLYFGAFRKEREPLYAKYLNSLDYEVYISCSMGNFALDNYQRIAPAANYIKKLTPDDFCNYKASIIIEDPYSHKNYTSLPTRFYECLSAGIVMFFDVSMRHTLEQAGVKDYQDYVVCDEYDLADKMSNCDYEYHANCQHELWHKDYHTMLKSQFDTVMEHIS